MQLAITLTIDAHEYLVSASKPSFAGSDPYDVLIDRRSDDNAVAITRWCAIAFLRKYT